MDEERSIDAVRVLLPGALWSSVKSGGFAGTAGLAVGGVAGVFRSTTPGFFALASGIQCFALGSSFWAARQCVIFYFARTGQLALSDVSPQQRRIASTFAGGVSGATTAALLRSRSNVLPGAIMFSLFGFLGQTAYNRVDAKEQAPVSYEPSRSLWQKLLHSRFNPMRVLSDEDYEHMLSEKLLRIEAEIALLDEQMTSLQQENPNA